MDSVSDIADQAKMVASVARLMQGASIESTFPRRADLDAARQILSTGTQLNLSLPASHEPAELCRLVAEVRAVGLEPVPHIAARALKSRNDAQDLLARLNGEAGVTRALVIAGDAERPAGPFADAQALIESGLFERSGFISIGIAGYPDGHPQISNVALASALARKIDAIYSRGLSVDIVSQFCFDGDRIVAWLRQLRYLRVDVPIKIGVAGPASLRTLLRYALKCGVRTAIKGAKSAAALQLLRESAPDRMIRTLSQITALSTGSVTVHVFSFGGLVRTAQWVVAAAAGEIATNSLENAL
jgi:methylenetetrahydrofolate reductase (NADPH)